MNEKMVLRDIYFGEPDAKYEIISGSERDITRFFKSFSIPTNLVLEDFLENRIMYITGLKGTGKTALLRYISMEAENYGHLTNFVLFKSEFDKQDKQDFVSAAKVIPTTFISNEDSLTSTEEDFALVWRWFLYKQLMVTIEENSEKRAIDTDKTWKKFCNLIRLVDPSEESDKKFPVLQKGNVRIDAKLFETFGMDLNLEFESPEEKIIRFSSIVKRIDNQFKKLKFNNKKIYILLDELELSFTTEEEYHRDINIIGGLIIASKYIYTICLQKSFPLKFICAIRSEVVRAISLAGNELNKEIEGFGININWHTAGYRFRDHALISIIVKRLVAAEEEAGISTAKEDIFYKYFDKLFQTVETERFIIDQSWERPRDVVRLLSLAKKRFPQSSKFTHSMFDTIRKDYAQHSWVEFTEELNAKYTKTQIESIRYILTNIVNPFTLKDFEYECQRKSTLYPDLVPELLEKYDQKTILSDLYRIGIIGNQGFRFVYKGYDDLILTMPMVVHRALWKYFATRRNRNIHL